MKKIILSILALSALNLNSFGQCSPSINGFEMKLSQLPNQKLSVQIRCTEETTQTPNAQLPKQSLSLDGLIFALAWPNTSNIHIEEITSSNYPFQILQDKKVIASMNKTSMDNIATFYQSSEMPVALKANWQANTWYEVATITYLGQLSENDFISFATCEYGISHPNSYSGNSHTDPWIAFMDMQTGEYQQYSPKMITEMPAEIAMASYNVYPNPSSTDFQVSINTPIATQVALQVLDINGQIVKTQIDQLQKGSNLKSINVQDIAAGNYSIKITDGKTMNYIQKVQKL